MDDLLSVFNKIDASNIHFKTLQEEAMLKMNFILFGTAEVTEPAGSTSQSELPTTTPQQTKKRVKKHLSSVHEYISEDNDVVENTSLRKSARASNSQLLAAAAAMEDEPTLSSSPQPVAPHLSAKPTRVDEVPARKESTIEQQSLMPPPPIPAATASAANTTTGDQSFARPQRAAKLKSEKCLKEPKLNQKLRRPTAEASNPRIKLEHEQRPSQMHDVTTTAQPRAASSASETAINDFTMDLVIEDDPSEKTQKGAKTRTLSVKIKREKSSLSKDEEQPQPQEAPPKEVIVEPLRTSLSVPLPIPLKAENISDESTMASTALSAPESTSVAPPKKTRKKKNLTVPKPIKVERFSEIGLGVSPVASRTRKGGTASGMHQRPGSVFEDAVDSVPVSAVPEDDAVNTPPSRISQVPSDVAKLAETFNQVVSVSGAAAATASDATMVLDGPSSGATHPDAAGETFVMSQPNPNATVTLDKPPSPLFSCDATFNLPEDGDGNGRVASYASTKLSMETARDTSQPRDDSLLTEDESFENRAAVANMQPPKPPVAKPGLPKLQPLALSAKAFKMPTRNNELFNPLVQSPVKQKVEAFENAAHAATAKPARLARLKSTKDNPGSKPSHLTPNAFTSGKDAAPALGRFLTPTQFSNTSSLAAAKKTASSASKAYPKVSTLSNLKSTNTAGSGKSLSRENSADEFRKGFSQQLEERKRQREQKHLLAAQQREAKERERAERMAKAAKEREDKRIRKQLEAEQKKRELDEINRKLRHQEDAEAVDAPHVKAAKLKAATEKEREMLTNMKHQQLQGARIKMPPPSPKLRSKYTWDMLHEDDSTDEEDKVSYKRPQPPSWSLSSVRHGAIRMQQHWPTDVIDSFFSVAPMTPDLREIFPNIDERQLKRNSSAVWATPPRYSELPKY